MILMTYSKDFFSLVHKLQFLNRSGTMKAWPIFFSLTLVVSCVTQAPGFDEDEWLKQVNAANPALLYGPHRDESGLFINPWMPRPEKRPKGNRFFFRKKEKFDNFPAEQYGPVNNTYGYLADSGLNSISFMGHASFIIRIDGVTILTDPFFSKRALIVSKKVKIPFDFTKLPQRPVVLISHNHYDHLDKWTVKQLVKKDAVFVVPLGLKEFFIKLGAKEVYELDWWQSTAIKATAAGSAAGTNLTSAGQVNFTFLPAQHWSLRIGQPTGTTLWGGFLIEASKTIYFSGDTGYFCGFKEFGKKYNIDYALLGAGAYAPRWFMHYQHMNIAEFFRAADDLNAGTAIPMHFGVISLSDEPLVYPLHEIKLHLEKHPEYVPRIKPLRIGEFISWKSSL
jgi:N-acyl-phosphatidylethanolamine-hydrolysing phospholipase D